jgi:hypothetical protein
VNVAAVLVGDLATLLDIYALCILVWAMLTFFPGASGSAIGTGQAVSVPLGSAVTASPALVVMVGAEGTNKSWQNAAAAGPAWAQRSTNSAGSSGCLLEDMTTGALIAWAALAQLTASQEWQGVVAAFQ